MLAGGWKADSALTEEEFQMVIGLQHHVQERAGREFAHFHPVAIKKQVVAGMNYLVKVQVSDDHYIHVKIYKPLPHTGEPAGVTEVHLDKSHHDEL